MSHTDLFVTDYMVEGDIDGFQFLAEVERRLGRRVHAVVLTGDTSDRIRQRISESPWPILHKPINLEQLTPFLTRSLPRDYSN